MARPLTTFGNIGIGFLFGSGSNPRFEGLKVPLMETDNEFFVHQYKEEGGSTLRMESGSRQTDTESTQEVFIHQYIDDLGLMEGSLIESESEMMGIHKYISSVVIETPLVQSSFGPLYPENQTPQQRALFLRYWSPARYKTSEVFGPVGGLFSNSEVQEHIFGDTFQGIEPDSILLVPLIQTTNSADIKLSKQDKSTHHYIPHAPIEQVVESDSEVFQHQYRGAETFIVRGIIESDQEVFQTTYFIGRILRPQPIAQAWSDMNFGSGGLPKYIKSLKIQQVGFITSRSEVFRHTFFEPGIKIPLMDSQSEVVTQSGGHPTYLENLGWVYGDEQFYFSGSQFVSGFSGPWDFDYIADEAFKPTLFRYKETTQNHIRLIFYGKNPDGTYTSLHDTGSVRTNNVWVDVPLEIEDHYTEVRVRAIDPNPSSGSTTASWEIHGRDVSHPIGQPQEATPDLLETTNEILALEYTEDAPPVNPIEVSAPIYWFEADQINQVADSQVNVWSDNSGNGYDASRAEGAPLLRENSIGSQPAVEFFASEKFTTPTIVGWEDGFSLLLIVKFDDGEARDNSVIWAASTTSGFTTRQAFRTEAGKLTTKYGNDSTEHESNAGNVVNATEYLIIIRKPVGSNVLEYFVNGIEVAQTVVSAGPAGADGADRPIQIGSVATSGGGSKFDGLLSAAIGWTRPLTDEEVININNYQNTKYGSLWNDINDIVVSDTFTDADGTLLSAHVPDIGNGNPWGVENAGDYDIQGNQLRGLFDFAEAWVLTGVSDMEVSVDFITAAGSLNAVNVLFRFLNITNFLAFLVREEDNFIALYKMVGGTSTNLVTGTHTINEGQTYRLKVRAIGADIECYIDDVLVLSATDATHQTETRAGLRRHNASNAMRLDNFEVRDLG